MISVPDQQVITQASQSAILLVRHLSALLTSSNPLLAEIVQQVFPKAAEIDQLLQRIDAFAEATKIDE